MCTEAPLQTPENEVIIAGNAVGIYPDREYFWELTTTILAPQRRAVKQMRRIAHRRITVIRKRTKPALLFGRVSINMEMLFHC